jgi:hypothetical protein
MDRESKQTIKFLEALANSKLELAELTHRLRSRPDVIRDLHSLECFKYRTHVALEGYVDIELRNGKAVAWWLEVNWDDEQWVIESCVLLNDNQPRSTQETIKEFPNRTAETLDECIEQLLQATSELVNDADFTIDMLTE